MKIFFTLCFTLLVTHLCFSQTCLPDSTYRDSSAGVYPRPVSADYPNAGIKKKACINKFYDLTLTVVVPSTILVPPLTMPIALDKVEIATKDAIANLPEGITYACNPPDCVFQKNTIGCLNLYGTPTANNNPGNYKPVISLKITAGGGFIVQTVLFPGPSFPGEYIIELLSENDCASSTNQPSELSTNWYPNPNEGILHSKSNEIEDVIIQDLSGREFYNCKHLTSTKIEIHLAAGMHLIKWKSGNQTFIQKIIIQ